MQKGEAKQASPFLLYSTQGVLSVLHITWWQLDASDT